MRAFFCKPPGEAWRICTIEDIKRFEKTITVLCTPANANDAAMLERINLKQPVDKLLTYPELMQ